MQNIITMEKVLYKNYSLKNKDRQLGLFIGKIQEILIWFGERYIDKIKHKGYGLAHIIDKHPELDLKLISDIVDKGKLNNQNNIRYRIEYKNYIIGLSSEYKGNKRTFIITAFERYKG